MIHKIKEPIPKDDSVADVAGEGGFGADRFGFSIRHNRAIIQPVCQLPDMPAHLAKVVNQDILRQRGDLTAFLDDNRAVFGELADDPRFIAVYRSILSSLFDRGVRKTFADLDQYAAPAETGQRPPAPQRKAP